MASKTHYATLQVDVAAEPEVIDVAYKRLARKYHPDLNRTPDAGKQMQELNAAYDVLRDPVKRRAYDQSLFQSQPFPARQPAASAAQTPMSRAEWSLQRHFQQVWQRLYPTVKLVPHFEVGLITHAGQQRSYQLDFAYPELHIGIALADSSRDGFERQRHFQQAGWHMFQFSSAQIKADAVGCAREVYELIAAAVMQTTDPHGYSRARAAVAETEQWYREAVAAERSSDRQRSAPVIKRIPHPRTVSAYNWFSSPIYGASGAVLGNTVGAYLSSRSLVALPGLALIAALIIAALFGVGSRWLVRRFAAGRLSRHDSSNLLLAALGLVAFSLAFRHVAIDAFDAISDWRPILLICILGAIVGLWIGRVRPVMRPRRPKRL